MNRRLLILLVLFLSTSEILFAQKKDFSYAQLFQGAPTDVTKSLPSITGWADDDHYLENRIDPADGKTKLMSVEVKTGKAVAYSAATESERGMENLPGVPPDAKNVTRSPDKKYAAFTLNNNLYIIDIATAKVTQVTN